MNQREAVPHIFVEQVNTIIIVFGQDVAYFCQAFIYSCVGES